MKALKNNSTEFVDSIITAISNCYAVTAEPSNTQLTALCYSIGNDICEQGEKAFVVHLAETLAAEFPAIKGFSARNLRRMRDFFRTYESNPRLLKTALGLGWTQNAVIMDGCESDAEREFYLTLAKKQNLSKLSLVRAIENRAFEKDNNTENESTAVATATEPVCHDVITAETNTDNAVKSKRAPFVTACEPFRQGSTAPKCEILDTADISGDIYSIDKIALHLKAEVASKLCGIPVRKTKVGLMPLMCKPRNLLNENRCFSERTWRQHLIPADLRMMWQPPELCSA